MKAGGNKGNSYNDFVGAIFLIYRHVISSVIGKELTNTE